MERQNLGQIYIGASPEAIDLLEKILQFNPYFRPTVDGCLSHPFFAGIRKEEKEVGATAPIKFDFEKEMLDKD